VKFTQHKLLIIGSVWPEPNSSAAGLRMMQLIDLFQKDHWKLVFASTAGQSEWSVNLSELGIETETIELNNASFNLFLEQCQPNAVLFDRFMTEEQFGWRVAETCPQAIRILDTEDLHFLRAIRTQEWRTKTNDSEPNWHFKACFREIASIYRCDLSLIISSAEMQLLTQTFGLNPQLLHYLPLLYASPNTALLPTYSDRKDFLFIGNFLHEPNMQTVIELKEKIWPMLRKKIPGVQLHIYGAYPSQKALGLQNGKEHFWVHGRADNLEECMQSARVLLAPIPFGAGIKGKLLDAMCNGLPSVTSSIGAEGIGNESNWPGFITDNTDDFVSAACQLYTQENCWKEAQEKGFERILEAFHLSHFESAFHGLLHQFIVTLTQHRNQNFIGALLQYHTFQSNKYFSKWIEEKNKDQH
jgi:glycosyltransferase involved in cell wall biosynthesis